MSAVLKDAGYFAYFVIQVTGGVPGPWAPDRNVRIQLGNFHVGYSRALGFFFVTCRN